MTKQKDKTNVFQLVKPTTKEEPEYTWQKCSDMSIEQVNEVVGKDTAVSNYMYVGMPKEGECLFGVLNVENVYEMLGMLEMCKQYIIHTYLGE